VYRFRFSTTKYAEHAKGNVIGRAFSPWLEEGDMGALRGAAPHAGMRPRRWRFGGWSGHRSGMNPKPASNVQSHTWASLYFTAYLFRKTRGMAVIVGPKARFIPGGWT